MGLWTEGILVAVYNVIVTRWSPHYYVSFSCGYIYLMLILQVLTVNLQMPKTAENPIKQPILRNLQRKLQEATAKRVTPTERQWFLKQENSGRVIREKIIVAYPVKKCPIFFGQPQYIGVFTRVRHSTLCWARLIQFVPWHTTVLSALLH
jgi:hypothetical protein